MTIPRQHHYLPRFYLERWAKGGKVVRYVRPLGAEGPLDCQRKAPKAVAYERDLYHLPDVQDPIESQMLELEFFQRVDDRAAVALRKLDALERGTEEDRVALSEFVISLLHRSPSRLKALRAELSVRTDGAPYEHSEGAEFDDLVKATANRLLAMLVASPEGKTLVSSFKTYKIDVSRSSKTLLTSDRPVTVSAQLVAPDAFMILPYAPDSLLILTHKEAIASAFDTQDHTALVVGINQAVVEQSEDMIIAADTSATQMIDRLFLRPQPGVIFDSIGLIRRKSPLIERRTLVQRHSRHDKASMRYLGR